MSDKSKWISAGDAVEETMRRKKCSRRAARRFIAKQIAGNKLPTREVKLSLPPCLDPAEAVESAADDPASIYTTLAELCRAYGFNGAEILAELRSGRLVAFALDESAMIRAEMGPQRFSGAEFGVSGDALIKWLAHPQTPAHLIDRFEGKPLH